MEPVIRTVILTVNDGSASDERVVATLEAIRELLLKGPFVETNFMVIPDEQALIRAKLRILSDKGGADLILTTGGANLSQKERTPDATREVIEREVPGLAEVMRIAGMRNSPRSALFRGVCGVRRQTLIVNLPGGPNGLRDSLAAILESLPPAVEYITGQSRSVVSGE
ncbi:MAG TPA: MogA/MoaB family molybdenum cofactor biosynthesis protein [Chloroflexota bacterium]|nr:MogA/MoaB family molybdenum cofactor biosynthesis protein [Chloroflexota bacterium]